MINKHSFITLAFIWQMSSTAMALSFHSGIDFNAHYQSHKTDWLYPNNSILRSHISRFGIGWTEPLNEYFYGGLKAGYLDISQADNPITTARLMKGHYLGIHLGSMPVNSEWFKLTLGVGYSYNQADRQEASQTVEIIWHQSLVNLQAAFQFVPQLTFTVGGKMSWIDGEERATGTISQIRSFEQDNNTGYYAGIDLNIDLTGSVGVSWEGGSQEGASIYFRRQF